MLSSSPSPSPSPLPFRSPVHRRRRPRQGLPALREARRRCVWAAGACSRLPCCDKTADQEPLRPRSRPPTEFKKRPTDGKMRNIGKLLPRGALVWSSATATHADRLPAAANFLFFFSFTQRSSTTQTTTGCAYREQKRAMAWKGLFICSERCTHTLLVFFVNVPTAARSSHTASPSEQAFRPGGGEHAGGTRAAPACLHTS